MSLNEIRIPNQSKPQPKETPPQHTIGIVNGTDLLHTTTIGVVYLLSLIEYVYVGTCLEGLYLNITWIEVNGKFTIDGELSL